MSSKRWEAFKEIRAARAILKATDVTIDELTAVRAHLARAQTLLTPPSKRKTPHEYRRTGTYAGVKTP